MALFEPFSAVPKLAGTFSVALGTCGAAAVTAVAVTINGLTTDMMVVVRPTASLPANLGVVQSVVTAANTLTLNIINPTAGSLAGGTVTFNFVAL